MTQEEKDAFKAAIEAAKAQGTHAWTNIANTMTSLIDAFERTGKKTRFAVGNTEQPLKHLVKEEQQKGGKRVSLKDTLPKNVLATSEKKTTRTRKK